MFFFHLNLLRLVKTFLRKLLRFIIKQTFHRHYSFLIYHQAKMKLLIFFFLVQVSFAMKNCIEDNCTGIHYFYIWLFFFLMYYSNNTTITDRNFQSKDIFFNESFRLRCNGTKIIGEFECERKRPHVVNLILKNNYLRKIDVEEVSNF